MLWFESNRNNVSIIVLKNGNIKVNKRVRILAKVRQPYISLKRDFILKAQFCFAVHIRKPCRLRNVNETWIRRPSDRSLYGKLHLSSMYCTIWSYYIRTLGHIMLRFFLADESAVFHFEKFRGGLHKRQVLRNADVDRLSAVATSHHTHTEIANSFYFRSHFKSAHHWQWD